MNNNHNKIYSNTTYYGFKPNSISSEKFIENTKINYNINDNKHMMIGIIYLNLNTKKSLIEISSL